MTGNTARKITEAIKMSGKTQAEIALEAGFKQPSVLSLVGAGLARMPIDRIPAFSAATGADAVDLLSTAMQEYLPEAWKVLSETSVPPQEAQLNICAPVDTVDRFKILCRENRYTYSTMLQILIDHYQQGDAAGTSDHR